MAAYDGLLAQRVCAELDRYALDACHSPFRFEDAKLTELRQRALPKSILSSSTQ